MSSSLQDFNVWERLLEFLILLSVGILFAWIDSNDISQNIIVFLV